MADTKRRPGRRGQPSELAEGVRVGKDEMNLAEFPTGILTNRSNNGAKTLRFKDNHGQLTVTGSDAYGLPTPIDTDVLVALIELTKQRNNFAEAKVNFTRYELIRLIGWANVGSSYERLEESLNRWAGVMLVYDGCWWDNRLKQYVSKTVHIITEIVIAEGKQKIERDGRQQNLPLSSFKWTDHLMESFQANNLKSLDTAFYFSLELPSSKQLFRFLDKRFASDRSEWTFGLEALAYEHVGLSRKYSAAKIKEKLGNSIDELERKGFLRPLSREERYFKTGGMWKIRLIDGRSSLPATVTPVLPETTPTPLIEALTVRGVTPKTASDLVDAFPAETIQIKIEEFDWEMAQPKPPKKPAGYLVKSIRDGYAASPGFVSAAERQQQQSARQAKEQAAAEERRIRQKVEARDKAERQAIDAHWASLTPAEQAELQAQADASADPEQLKLETGALKSMGRRLRRIEHIRQLLRDRNPG